MENPAFRYFFKKQKKISSKNLDFPIYLKEIKVFLLKNAFNFLRSCEKKNLNNK